VLSGQPCFLFQQKNTPHKYFRLRSGGWKAWGASSYDEVRRSRSQHFSPDAKPSSRGYVGLLSSGHVGDTVRMSLIMRGTKTVTALYYRHCWSNELIITHLWTRSEFVFGLTLGLNIRCAAKYRVAHEKPTRRLVDQSGRRSRTLYRKLNKCKCEVLTG